MAIKEELRRHIIEELEGEGEGSYPSFSAWVVFQVKAALNLPQTQLSGIIQIMEEKGCKDEEIINLLFNALEDYYESGILDHLNLFEKGTSPCPGPSQKNQTCEDSEKQPPTT